MNYRKVRINQLRIRKVKALAPSPENFQISPNSWRLNFQEGKEAECRRSLAPSAALGIFPFHPHGMHPAQSLGLPGFFIGTILGKDEPPQATNTGHGHKNTL